MTDGWKPQTAWSQYFQEADILRLLQETFEGEEAEKFGLKVGDYYSRSVLLAAAKSC